MQGLKRRVVYISLYEGIAIVAASAGLALMSGQGLGHSGVLAVIASVIAVLWNLLVQRPVRALGVAPGGARPQRAPPDRPRDRLRRRPDRLPGAGVRLVAAA